jgi:hypothetical protein
VPRSEKRGIAWAGMLVLERAGLGMCERVSDQRDKLVLDTAHPAASRLTNQADADGFIRSDKGSFLLRHASASLSAAVRTSVRGRPMKSDKGLEFRWTELENDDIRAIFRIVRSHAGLT